MAALSLKCIYLNFDSTWVCVRLYGSIDPIESVQIYHRLIILTNPRWRHPCWRYPKWRHFVVLRRSTALSLQLHATTILEGNKGNRPYSRCQSLKPSLVYLNRASYGRRRNNDVTSQESEVTMMLRHNLRTDAQICGKSASQASLFVRHGRGVNRVYRPYSRCQSLKPCLVFLNRASYGRRQNNDVTSQESEVTMMLRHNLRTDAQSCGKSATQASLFVRHGRGVNRVYCIYHFESIILVVGGFQTFMNLLLQAEPGPIT